MCHQPVRNIEGGAALGRLNDIERPKDTTRYLL